MIALADKISKSFGAQTLYTGATLQLNAGERWALVGPNGAGKTTLLKILMGEESADEGTVSFARDTTIGYLEQETQISADTTALEEVIDSAYELKQTGHLLTELEHKISIEGDERERDALLERYGHARERFERLGGYEIEARARAILGGLGFPISDFDRPASEFSGGWQMRIALAKLLLRHPDLLLLDEPTNHLDFESVLWFEQFLSSYDGSVLIVSHDRAFMDACVTHVASLENRMLVTYTGTYSSYLKQREDNLEQLKAKRAAQERDIAHMEVFIDRFRYKPTKAKQVQERIKRVEKIREELVVLPEQNKRVHFAFPAPPRTGDSVVSLEQVSKSYGDNLVYEDVDLTLYRGDHVVLIGPNGSGKSTLMKLIAKRIDPTCGRVEYGQNVSCAYYAQHQLENLDSANTVFGEIDKAAPGWTGAEVRRLLGAFLFRGDDVEKRVSVLSGGERARLALAKMLISPDPLLLLDEPTNHLDIDSVDILERALATFDGTIVFISHDEHLIRSIATKIVDVRDHMVTLYDGDYEYYRFKRAQLEAESAPLEPAQAAAGKTLRDRSEVVDPENRLAGGGRNVKTREQRRLEAEERQRHARASKQTRHRLEAVEAALEPAQKRYDELMQLMATEELYHDAKRFDECMAEYTALSKKIALLEAEWLELSEALENTP